jgi:hypothetical protein
MRIYPVLRSVWRTMKPQAWACSGVAAKCPASRLQVLFGGALGASGIGLFGRPTILLLTANRLFVGWVKEGIGLKTAVHQQYPVDLTQIQGIVRWLVLLIRKRLFVTVTN